MQALSFNYFFLLSFIFRDSEEFLPLQLMKENVKNTTKSK